MSLPPHIGQLRSQVVIETPTEADDATTGGVATTWATHATVYMQIRRKTVRERLANTDQVVAGGSADGWMRYLSTVTSKMRVVDGSDVWRIDGPPENWMKKDEWLVLPLVMDE
jgi:head-tail adaptor